MVQWVKLLLLAVPTFYIRAQFLPWLLYFCSSFLLTHPGESSER